MKTTFRYILFAIVACTMCACESNDLIDFFASKYYLETQESVNIGGTLDSSATFEIKADCAWTITGLPGWLSATPTSGTGDQQITLKATASNPDPANKRTETIKVTADNGKLNQSIKVTQDQGPETINFIDKIDFNCYASEQTHPLSCQGEWTITASSWVHVTPTSGKGDAMVTISVDNYRGTTAQEGELQIKVTNDTKRVPVTQAAYVATLNLISDDFISETSTSCELEQFPVSGGQKYMTLESSDSWSMEGFEAIDWITISPVSDDKGGVRQITISAKENKAEARKGQVTITNTANPPQYKIVKFSQEGASHYLTLISEKNIYFDVEGETKVITVKSTSTPKVMSGTSDWLKVVSTESKGNNLYEIALRTEPNRQNSERTATIVIDNESGDEVTVSAKQGAFTSSLILSQNEIVMPGYASTAEITVTCNVDWIAQSDRNWCRVAKEAGRVIVMVDDNDSEVERTAIVTVALTSGTYSVTCKVIQNPGGGVTFERFTITDITKHSFFAMGRYYSESPVSEYGLCVSDTNQTPTIENAVHTMEADGHEGEFFLEAFDLKPATTYYVRAYARNATGIYYTEVLKVTTAGAIPNEDDNTPPDPNN